MSNQGEQPSVTTYALVGLVILWIVLALYFYFPWGGEPSPESLEQTALTGSSVEEREKAAVKLASLGLKSQEHLRRVMKATKDANVRAACVQGLGALWDYDSMELLLAALDDESAMVRGQAAIIVQRMIGIQYDYKAEDPPAKRKAIAKSLQDSWKHMQGSEGLEDFKKLQRAAVEKADTSS